jgi:hypothetical protein
MRKSSWILLTVVGALTLVISFVSAYLAYGRDYPIAGTSIAEVAGGREPVLLGLRGVRGTSAAYGAAFAVLFLSIVLGPYRRGEVWAWWALFGAYAALALIVALRLPLLGTMLGIVPMLVQIGAALLGLLLDVKRVLPR